MFKLIASILLGISLIVLTRAAVISLQTESTGEIAIIDTDNKQDEHVKRTPSKTVEFYPSVPAPLPDLNEKYLFNEERFLLGEKEEEAENEAAAANGSELSVDMNTVFYAGSIIVGDLRKGLISYTDNKAPTATASKDRKKTPTPLQTKKYAQLVAGDSLSGYKVDTVDPDRIIFKKGTETIEKLLNDPEKERLKPPPPPKKTVVRNTSTARQGRTTAPTRKVVQSSRTVRPAKTVTSRRLPVQRERIQIPGVPPRN